MECYSCLKKFPARKDVHIDLLRERSKLEGNSCVMSFWFLSSCSPLCLSLSFSYPPPLPLFPFLSLSLSFLPPFLFLSF